MRYGWQTQCLCHVETFDPIKEIGLQNDYLMQAAYGTIKKGTA